MICCYRIYGSVLGQGLFAWVNPMIGYKEVQRRFFGSHQTTYYALGLENRFPERCNGQTGR